MTPGTSDPAAESVESVLTNRPYRLVRFLGRGGVGEVWVVESTRMAKQFALKVLHRWLVKDRFFVERFELEARGTASLEHPHIVSVSDYWVAEDRRHCLVMQLLQGHTLAQELQTRRRLPASEVVRISCEVLAALSLAHDRGMIHRDIKPENIFLHQMPNLGIQVKVLDFGLARVNSSDSALARFQPTLATRTGTTVGSPRFASPEALRGKVVDERTDVYSLGIVMYLSLVGIESQFDFTTIPVFTPPSQLGAVGCDERLDAAILRAVQPRPEDRFQSVREFLDALQPLQPLTNYSQHQLPRELLTKF